MSSICPIDFYMLFDESTPYELKSLFFDQGFTYDRGYLYVYYRLVNQILAPHMNNSYALKIANDGYNKLNDIDKQHLIDRWEALYTQNIIASRNLDPVINKIYYYRIFNLSIYPSDQAIIEMVNNEMKNPRYVKTIGDITDEKKNSSSCILI